MLARVFTAPMSGMWCWKTGLRTEHKHPVIIMHSPTGVAKSSITTAPWCSWQESSLGRNVTCSVTGAAGEDTEQHHGNSLASRRDWQELESGRSMEEQDLAAAAAPPAPAAIRAFGAPRRPLKGPG